MSAIPDEPAFDVPGLLARERGGLMASLGRLAPPDWDRRTSCPGWRVRDLVSHLWATDVHVLSRLRDGYVVGPVGADHADVVAAVNEHNERWVDATRGLSPRVLLDRLYETGPQVTTLFRLGDPAAPAERVSWAGDDIAPLWFCGARELTERFVHQQQIRAAVGQLHFDDDEVLAAVVDTFVYAFPRTLAAARAEPGTAVSVEVTGPVARRWTFIRSVDGWTREDGVVSSKAAAFLRTDADAFWRLLSGGLDRTSQVERVDLAGSPTLFSVLRDTRAVLV